MLPVPRPLAPSPPPPIQHRVPAVWRCFGGELRAFRHARQASWAGGTAAAAAAAAGVEAPAASLRIPLGSMARRQTVPAPRVASPALCLESLASPGPGPARRHAGRDRISPEARLRPAGRLCKELTSTGHSTPPTHPPSESALHNHRWLCGPGSGHRLPARDTRQPAPDNRRPAPDHRLREALG